MTCLPLAEKVDLGPNKDDHGRLEVAVAALVHDLLDLRVHPYTVVCHSRSGSL